MSDEINKLQLFINYLIKDKGYLKILEAGCGSTSHLNFGKQVILTGIDISRKQLEKNRFLDKRILGDIQSYNFQRSEFDIIICWDVLEHINYPVKAIKNLFNGLKENGIFIIAAPNIYSIKGFVVKYSPYWFHVWVYRNIIEYRNPNNAQYLPFRTVFRYSIAPGYIIRLAKDNNLSVIYYSIYESNKQKRLRNNKIINLLFLTLSFFIRVLSFRRINALLTDYIIVLKK